MKITTVGIDLAKNVFQVHGVDERGKAVLTKQLKRDQDARSIVRTAKDKDDRLSRWVTRIAQNRHHNVAAVALANKTARIAWAMMKNGMQYQPNLVAQ